jgi:hypothetical protein
MDGLYSLRVNAAVANGYVKRVKRTRENKKNPSLNSPKKIHSLKSRRLLHWQSGVRPFSPVHVFLTVCKEW